MYLDYWKYLKAKLKKENSEVVSATTQQNMTGEILLYQNQAGDIKIDVRLEDETVWLTQDQMATLFGKAKSTINEHIKNVFSEGELDEKVVVRKFRITTQHGAMAGKTQEVEVNGYNLDVIISVGYRVKSPQGTQFRIWATQRLKEYIIKGFALNDERIREIRISERVFYQKIKDIYTTSMRNAIFPLIATLALTACTTSRKTAGNADFMQLKDHMTGTFNSAAQAARDSNYFDITLHMYPIWQDRPGVWLYVEQAVTASQDKPYRQRIYQLEQIDRQTFVSKVYTIQNEKDYVNAWKTPEAFGKLPMEGIELKSGCEVVLKKSGNQFAGATGDKTCPSELRGASYATSKVTVYPGKIVSWDQGFNAQGVQVWGATLGGYEFLKIAK